MVGEMEGGMVGRIDGEVVDGWRDGNRHIIRRVP